MSLIATAKIETGEINFEKAKVIQLEDYRARRVEEVNRDQRELLLVAHARELRFSLPFISGTIE